MRKNLLTILVAAAAVAISVNALMQRNGPEDSALPSVPSTQAPATGN